MPITPQTADRLSRQAAAGMRAELSDKDFTFCSGRLSEKFDDNILDICSDLETAGGDERVMKQIRQWWTDIVGERLERTGNR